MTLVFLVDFASLISSPGFDRSMWTSFIGWCVVRALLCIAAIVGAVSMLRPRSTDITEGREEAVLAPNGDRSAFSMSVLLGCAGGATVVIGAVLAIFSFYSGEYANLNLALWTRLSFALQELTTFNSGTWQFVAGPLTLVLAVILLRASRVWSDAAQRLKLWLIALAVLELAVTVTYVVATVVPTSDFGGPGFDRSEWSWFVGWCGVRILICTAAMIGLISLPKATGGVWRSVTRGTVGTG